MLFTSHNPPGILSDFTFAEKVHLKIIANKPYYRLPLFGVIAYNENSQIVSHPLGGALIEIVHNSF